MEGSAIESEHPLMETRPRVLAKFFEASRDNWKRKCQAATADVKRFRDKVRDIHLSRQMWREQAEKAELEQQRLAAEVQRLQEELASVTAIEKKASAPR